MKKVIIKRVYPEHSSKWINENKRQLLPVIEFWDNTIGNLHGVCFKFWWWKYWIKINITYLYQ